MEIKEYFCRNETGLPKEVSRLRRVSFALRRGGLKSMEELCRMQAEAPERLMDIQDIGVKSLPLIERVCILYQKENSGEWLEVGEKPPPPEPERG